MRGFFLYSFIIIMTTKIITAQELQPYQPYKRIFNCNYYSIPVRIYNCKFNNAMICFETIKGTVTRFSKTQKIIICQPYK